MSEFSMGCLAGVSLVIGLQAVFVLVLFMSIFVDEES